MCRKFLHFASFFHGKSECGPVAVTSSALEAVGPWTLPKVYACLTDVNSRLGNCFFLFVK